MKFTIREKYVASDGEQVLLSVDVTPADGKRQTAEQEARNYFAQFGYRVVEDAKAKGRWPLPPDHPNAPQTA